MNPIEFNQLFKVFYTLILLLLTLRLIKWLVKYVYLVYTVNKIPTAYTMLPFIGNAHQLKPGMC